MSTAFWVWLAVMIALIVLEAATTQLVAVWFIVGAFVSLISAIFIDNIYLHILLVVVFSALSLLLLRPIAKGKLNNKRVPTNADMVIGKTAVVIETIDNDAAKGRVQVSGLDWAARSYDKSIIQPGSKVGVCAIDGVKLIVVPIKED